MVVSFFQLLKDNSFIRMAGAVILFAYALSSFMFFVLMIDSLAGSLEDGASTPWQFYLISVIYFALQAIAFFVYPYYAGFRLGRYGLVFGFLWSVSILLFVPLLGFAAGKIIGIESLFSKIGYDLQ